MKRIYLWIFLLFTLRSVFAQNNIVHYEYWLDSNYTSKVQADVSPVPAYHLQTTIPCQAMDVGLHVLSARFRDANGAWSPTVTSLFYKAASDTLKNSRIVAYEYWLDNNYTSKVHADVSPVPAYNLQTTIPCQAMDVGLHVLSARFKDTNGAWSPTVTSTFYKAASDTLKNNGIVAYEFWLDDDYAHCTKETTALASTFNLSDAISMQTVGTGLHSFSIRFKDVYGRWSSTVSQHFHKFPSDVVDRKLVAYEYWINDDYSKKIRVAIAPQQSFALLDSVNCASGNQRINTLSFRFLDDSGLWSATLTENFYQKLIVSVNLTYTKSALTGETPAIESYPDYANVGFTLYNTTKKEDITDVAFQYPNIVLSQMVDIGDSIAITAISYSATNGFEPITETIVVSNTDSLTVTFNITQRGYIRSSYLNSANAANVGIVYDSTGSRIAQYDYIDRTLTTDPMEDGTYYLLSMAKSPNFNSIQNLSGFASTELVQNTHYILQTLQVKSGVITTTTVPTIPELDESQLYYTEDSTVFSVNKALIALDNFVTLRSEIFLKSEYQTQVGNVKLIVDIPAQCTFMNGSVMIGETVFSGYTLQNNQLTVPLANSSDVVHFCITPTQGGDYAPNAFIEFTLAGKTIRQPIGAAYFKAEELKIYVPAITSHRTIPVMGIVPSNSLVKVYDNDTRIGQTTALANGHWTIQYNLADVNSFSFHNIRAEVTTIQGSVLQTEIQEVVYDETFNEISRVTMYNTAHAATSSALQEYRTTFDFQSSSMKGSVYWYWPNYPDFTFTIEFEKPDTTLVSNVRLHVLTSSGDVVTLPTIYDNAKKLWVATGKFNSNSLPINVQVLFDRNYVQWYEPDTQNTAKMWVEDIVREFSQLYDKYKECGDITGIGANYFTKIKNLYKLNPTIPLTPVYGILGDSTGVCFSNAALRLNDFLASALTMSKNDYASMPNGDQVKELIQLIHEALNKMLLNPCDCRLTYIYIYAVPAIPVHDPSGFVYEAVPSNRLQGVTASIYYKTAEGEAVLWDAAEYEQENPLITNEFGEYGWDVPQGSWQVKYEKEGYEPVTTDWLPVPPPQLDINIGMVNAIPPFVKTAQGYEDGIEIAFSKFMLPASLTTNLITVTRNGLSETGGKIVFLDAEENPIKAGENFVSKVRFVPSVPFLMTDEVILTVDSMVLSYAGKNMTADFVQKITIQKEVKTITAAPVLNLIINGKDFIEVTAAPYDAAAGKTITARSVSSVLATVTGSATLDAGGKAKLQVTGQLPGSTQIILSLDGTDLKTTVDVNIAMELAGTAQVATPVASIPSGSTVTKNTAVSLSSATDGAAIYYTTDGTTPSGLSGIEYTQPIVIVSDTIIRAIAIKQGMSDSEVAVFEYTVKEDIIEQVATPVASIPTGSIVTKNTTVSLSSATDGAAIYYTTDGTTPSGLSGIEYTQPIVIVSDTIIRAIAIKQGMSDSEIAVFEYTVDMKTGINLSNRTVILFVKNQTLIIRGLELGDPYTIHTVLGDVVVQGSVTNEIEQQITLPYKGIFVVSTPSIKAKVLVK